MSIPEIRAEAWEGDEQVIVVSGLGVVGKTLSKRDAVIVTRWLRTARELFAANERAQVAEAYGELSEAHNGFSAALAPLTEEATDE